MNTRIVIGPNASLSGPQAALFFGMVCAAALGVAGAWAALGFWPVLPFAGLEVLVLGTALAVALRRNRYREVIRFEEGEVWIEFGRVGLGVEARCRMPRLQTRAFLEHGGTRTSPTRLVLSCPARRLEIGRCLTDEERTRLVARLKQLLTPV
ncbi:MAG: DUF2244 domain-containing protein [Gammaproteobacteria bacterium]|nr:DUF2244 domain-containing protein [Gammaproteobacteria bacterium]